jgi:hypothetical protein
MEQQTCRSSCPDFQKLLADHAYRSLILSSSTEAKRGESNALVLDGFYEPHTDVEIAFDSGDRIRYTYTKEELVSVHLPLSCRLRFPISSQPRLRC